jgi:hypothetical protein
LKSSVNERKGMEVKVGTDVGVELGIGVVVGRGVLAGVGDESGEGVDVEVVAGWVAVGEFEIARFVAVGAGAIFQPRSWLATNRTNKIAMPATEIIKIMLLIESASALPELDLELKESVTGG